MLDAALTRLAATPVLLVALDFDGSLAPIVPHPEHARMTPRARRALAALARQPHTRVAVISGRALADLDRRLGDFEEAVLRVGGHGSEFEPESGGRLDARERALLREVRAAVDAAAEGLDGVEAEHKDASSCLHYRRASRDDACRAVWRLIRARRRWHADGLAEPPVLRRGKKVVELSVIATNKGDAITRLRNELGASAVLYVGDDRTDEDAFGALGADDIGVKVGSGPTRARFRVPDPEAVAELLIRLLEARRTALAASVSEPIERLSLLSDRRTAALVTPGGTVCWLCPERFDNPAVFASLLGGPTAGHFTIRPAGRASRGMPRYRDGSLVLETRWPELSVVDWLDPDSEHGTVLVREVVPATKGARCEVVFAPRPNFARQGATIESANGALTVEAGALSLALSCPGVAWSIAREGNSDVALAEVELDAPLRFVLRCGDAVEEVTEPRMADDVTAWWAGIGPLELPERWREEAHRSALTLRALVHQPTGAMVAAATTSLPEVLGGERNWDYRYCWPRDAAYASDALLRLGSRSEAFGFLRWLARVVDDADGGLRSLRPVYGLSGEMHLVEGELGHLMGYATSHPVRVGNAAAEQLQVDVYGAVVDLVWTSIAVGGSIDDELWRLVRKLIEGVEARWDRPDAGIWEQRHRIRHHVHSKVMAWVATDRALRIARITGRSAEPTWAPLRDRIAEEVLRRGWCEERRTFSAAYDCDDLDAAVLSVVLSGLLPPDDPRARDTVDAVWRELRRGPTVMRYDFDDGLPGREGGFHICASWLVEALAAVGRRADAEALFSDILGCAGPTGLLSEMVDPDTHAALGNTPQAYSHTGVIWNALTLSNAPTAAARTAAQDALPA